MSSKLIEKAARVAHEACRTWAKCNDEVRMPPSWDALDGDTRGCILSGVKMFLQDPHIHAGALHQQWVGMMYEKGWRAGPVRDVAKMISPNLVPFDELPLKEKMKDHLFKGVVVSFRELFK